MAAIAGRGQDVKQLAAADRAEDATTRPGAAAREEVGGGVQLRRDSSSEGVRRFPARGGGRRNLQTNAARV